MKAIVQSLSLGLAVGLAALASAAPLDACSLPPRAINATNTTSACASVHSQVAATPHSQIPQVPAQLAYDCLTSIPFNASAGSLLIDSLKPYVEWQSTLAYLKDPPAEYAEKVQPAVDIIAGLEIIKANITAGKYASEYHFGVALYTLFQSAHDGHFSYIPDTVGFFGFGRPLALVSVADDQYSFPGVFEYTDIVGLHFKNISYTPSPIALIDDEDVSTHLQKLSQVGSLQDRDALYNNMFYNLAQVSLQTAGTGAGMFAGNGRARWVYPGPNTTLTFLNGSTRTVENFARVSVSFANVESGEDLAKYHIVYADAQANSASQAVSAASIEEDVVEPSLPTFGNPNINSVVNRGVEKRQTTSTPPPGYPQPLVQSALNLISGYFLEGEGYEDIAVLAVPNFVATSTVEKQFQTVSDQLIEQALAANKTKLIIDLSANGGGTILQAYDLFKKLFPSLEPYGASRYRANPYLDAMGQVFSDFGATHPRNVSETNSTVLNLITTYFNYRSDLNETNQPFPSWQDKYGPHAFHDDNYTSLARWNLSDPLIKISSGGIEISGYGNRSNVTTQPFLASNILMVFDGYCASTCTIFSEFMRQQAGIKTIAMGGRPSRDPIQAVGGTKGVNNLAWTLIKNYAQYAVRLGGDRDLFAPFSSDLPTYRSGASAGINVRDGIRQGDADQTPLQFTYELADCRLWYTPDMIIDASAVWRAAADAGFNNKLDCVDNNPGPAYKREETPVTTRLTRREIKESGGISFEALMDSVGVYTDPNVLEMEADGFMMP